MRMTRKGRLALAIAFGGAGIAAAACNAITGLDANYVEVDCFAGSCTDGGTQHDGMSVADHGSPPPDGPVTDTGVDAGDGSVQDVAVPDAPQGDAGDAGDEGIVCTGLCLQQVTLPGQRDDQRQRHGLRAQRHRPRPQRARLRAQRAGAALHARRLLRRLQRQVSGSPLVSAITGRRRHVHLTNMPVGANIPLVIQNGRWRRQVIIPSVAACVDTPRSPHAHARR